MNLAVEDNGELYLSGLNERARASSSGSSDSGDGENYSGNESGEIESSNEDRDYASSAGSSDSTNPSGRNSADIHDENSSAAEDNDKDYVPRYSSADPHNVDYWINDESKLLPGHFYSSVFVRRLLRNKHIVIIGDSIQRGVYKDLVLLLQEDRLLNNDKTELKAKGELNFMNDRLVFRTELSNGRDYTELREYQSRDGYHLIQYYFITRCFNELIEIIFNDLRKLPPDVVLMNSCLWDISRYGKDGEVEYKENIGKLFTRVREFLPYGNINPAIALRDQAQCPSTWERHTLFAWCTTLPLASEITPSGFLLEEIQFLAEGLRTCVLNANHYVAQIATAFGIDVLDLHHYIRPLTRHREKDGVHWDHFAHRHITDLILTFLMDSWGYNLPENVMEHFDRTNGKIDLKHLDYESKPDFLKRHVKALAALAKEVEPRDGDSDVEESEEEEEELLDAEGNRIYPDDQPGFPPLADEEERSITGREEDMNISPEPPIV